MRKNKIARSFPHFFKKISKNLKHSQLLPDFSRSRIPAARAPPAGPENRRAKPLWVRNEANGLFGTMRNHAESWEGAAFLETFYGFSEKNRKKAFSPSFPISRFGYNKKNIRFTSYFFNGKFREKKDVRRSRES